MDATFDLATAAGVASLTLVLVQIVKKQFFNRSWSSFGIICNVTTVLVSFGLSFGAMLVLEGIDMHQAFANGVLGAMTSLGGYEAMKNFVASIVSKR